MFLVIGIVYSATLAPTIVGGDSAEFVSVAKILGIPHPPGYPLYTLLAHLATWLPGNNNALKVNRLSAVLGMAAAGLICYLVTSSCRPSSSPSLKAILAGLAASLIWAFSPLFWSQAVVAEVYTFHIFLVVVYLACLFAWVNSLTPKWLYRCAFAVGLGLANHPVSLLLTVPLAFQIVLTVSSTREIKMGLLLTRTALWFLAPLLFYLYLPIRAHMNPPMNWGHPDTWSRLLAHIMREQYRGDFNAKNFLLQTLGFRLTLQNLFSYGRWLIDQYTWLVLFAIPGVISNFRKNWKTGVVLLWIWCVGGFLWGASQTDFDRWMYGEHLLTGHLPLVFWIGWGFYEVFQRFKLPKTATHGIMLSCLLVPLAGMTAHWTYVDRHRDYFVYDYSRCLLESLPPKATLFVIGDAPTFPLFYLQQIEGIHPDVEIFDPLGGQIFKNTPSRWILLDAFGPIPEVVHEVETYIKTSGRPTFILPRLALRTWIDADWVPYGLVYQYYPKGTAPSSRPPFPWNKLNLRWVKDPSVPLDYSNYILINWLLVSKISEILPDDVRQKSVSKLWETDVQNNQATLSLIALYQGQLEEALRYASHALSELPREPRVYTLLGLIYQVAGQPATANEMRRYAAFLEERQTVSAR